MASDEHLRKVCGTYFQQLVKKGYPVDSQYVDATLHILNYQSVLFSTPFTAISPYICSLRSTGR